MIEELRRAHMARTAKVRLAAQLYPLFWAAARRWGYPSLIYLATSAFAIAALTSAPRLLKN